MSAHPTVTKCVMMIKPHKVRDVPAGCQSIEFESTNDKDVTTEEPLQKTIDIKSLLYKLFELVVMFTIVLSTLIAPIQTYYDMDDAFLTAVIYLCDAIYVIYMLSRFWVPFGPNQTWKLTKKQVCKKYVFGSLIVDCFSLIPIHLASTSGTASTSDWWMIALSIRWNTILRMHVLLKTFLLRGEQLGTIGYVWQSTYYVVAVATAFYCCTAIWFMTSGLIRIAIENAAVKLDSFLGQIDFVSTAAYYTGATILLVGYGDIVPHTYKEKLLAMVFMLVGIVFIYGIITSYMASVKTNSDSKRSAFMHKKSVIDEYLKDHAVSEETTDRVAGFHDFSWRRSRGNEDTEEILKELPLPFQAEICLHINKNILEQCPLFENVCTEFTRMIALAIKRDMYIPKQVILNKGEIRHTMFYIDKGSVELLLPPSPKPVKILKEGSFFGEAALLFNTPRAATIRSRAYCELLVLDRSDMMKVLGHFPDVQQRLYSVINKRCDEALVNITPRNSIDYQGDTSLFVTEATEESDIALKRKKREPSISVNKDGSFTFHPNGIFLFSWEILLCFVVTLLVFGHTFVAAFKSSMGNHGYDKWFGALYLIDILYWLDIVIYSRTAIMDNNGSLVDDVKLIMRKNVRTIRFWLDLVCVIPFELPFFGISELRSRWLVVTLVRTNRCLKLYRVFTMLRKWEADISLDITTIRFVKLTFLICSLCHLCGCVWFFQACYGYDDTCAMKSWVAHERYNSSDQIPEVYVTALYWSAAAMTSTGYGDIRAHSPREQLIAMIVFVIGMLLFGYCLSNITATLTNKLYPKVKFMGRINAVTSFLKEQKISSHLIARVEKYLALLWSIHKGEVIPGKQLLLGNLPKRLQLDVSYEEMVDILSHVTVFRQTDDNFIKLLASKLVTYVLMPGDMVVYRGDVGREMYIIRRGLVEVISPTDGTVVATLGRGGFFGEVGLIFGESRTADVRTKTYCEIAMLKKSDLDEVMQKYPMIRQQFKCTSRNETILQKIKNVALTSGRPDDKKAKKIDLIEQTKQRTKKSAFGKKLTTVTELGEEEMETYELLRSEFITPYKNLHPIIKYLSFLLQKKTINPAGTFFHVWTLASVIVSCMFYVTNTLEFTFLHGRTFLVVINYVIDIFFLVDIYIKFHVGYFNKDGILITHPTSTALQYLRTNFWIDFIAFLPFDNIARVSIDSGVFYIVKLNRLLHFVRIRSYFSYLEEPITSKNTFIQSIKFTIYTYLIIHIFACAWFKMACPGGSNDILGMPNSTLTTYCVPGSWAVSEGVNLTKENSLRQYVTSMYWASATECGVGYGDIHAWRVPEKTLSLFCMIFGVVFFGYIIASVTASLANADIHRVHYQSKLNSVKRFLKEHRVEATLAKRIKEFYKFLWHRNRGVDMDSLFEGIPSSMQADITLSLYKDIIESVPLFQGTEAGFTKMLSLYIRPLLLPKGEYIVRKGDIGEQMFFIHKGVVEVVSEHDTPIVFDTMSAGRFFGEISTIFSCPRTASVRTQTNADLFVLKKTDLDTVLGHYPHIRSQITETAEERQRLVAERARIAAEKRAEEDRKKALMVMSAMRRFSVACFGKEENDDADEETVELKLKPKAEKAIEEATSREQSIDLDDLTLKDRAMKWYKRMLEYLKFTIPTDSPIHWLPTINCLLILVVFLTTTYMAAYRTYLKSIFVVNVVAEMSFFVEIFLKFHMRFLNDSGDEVSDPSTIAYHYLKGEFVFDAISNFPLWIFAAATDDFEVYYSYLSLLQLLRMKKLRDIFKTLSGKLDTDIMLVRFCENTFRIIMQIQIAACLWYRISLASSNSTSTSAVDSWIRTREVQVNRTLAPYEFYADSVYWALATMTSTGYGDIVATKNNNYEMVFAATVMVFGKILFGFVLGNVASTMANMKVLRVAFEEKYAAMLEYMEDQKLPSDIRTRIVNIFQFIWNRNKGTKIEDLFKGLPPCLHCELYYNLIGKRIGEVPIFNGCEVNFIRMISSRAKFTQFHENEYIYKQGDIGKELFFVQKGSVEISTQESSQILGNTDYFGEDAILKQHFPRSNSAKTITHLDIFSITVGDLEEAYRSYPGQGSVVKSNIEGITTKQGNHSQS